MSTDSNGVVAINANTVNKRLPFIAASVLSIVGIGFILFALLIIFGGILNDPTLDTQPDNVAPTPTAPDSFADSDYECDEPIVLSADSGYYICATEPVPFSQVEGYAECAQQFAGEIETIGLSQRSYELFSGKVSKMMQNLTIADDCTVSLRRFVSEDGLTPDISLAGYADSLVVYREYPDYTTDDEGYTVAVYDFETGQQQSLATEADGAIVFEDQYFVMYVGLDDVGAVLLGAYDLTDRLVEVQELADTQLLTGEEEYGSVTITGENGVYQVMIDVVEAGEVTRDIAADVQLTIPSN